MSRSWDKDAREEAREGFKNALVQEFNKMYGTDVNDIGSWQGLCRVLGIAPVPDKLNECREVCSRNWNIILKRSLILVDVHHDRQWKKYMSTSSTLSIGQTISGFSQLKWPSVVIRRTRERYSRRKTRTRADCLGICCDISKIQMRKEEQRVIADESNMSLWDWSLARRMPVRENAL
jgi:hypothetical protein